MSMPAVPLPPLSSPTERRTYLAHLVALKDVADGDPPDDVTVRLQSLQARVDALGVADALDDRDQRAGR